MKLETILCIEGTVISRYIEAMGFVHINEVNILELLAPQNLWFAPRMPVEERPDFRQIIPYIILRFESSVVVYQRTTQGSESRLHGVLSLGFGGHVGLDDAVLDGRILNVDATLKQAAYREVQEEVDITAVMHRQRIGIIYDNADAISRVHLGLVEIWDVNNPTIFSAEAAIAGCQLLPISQLSSLNAQMEGWSRLCIPFLFASLP